MIYTKRIAFTTLLLAPIFIVLLSVVPKTYSMSREEIAQIVRIENEDKLRQEYRDKIQGKNNSFKIMHPAFSSEEDYVELSVENAVNKYLVENPGALDTHPKVKDQKTTPLPPKMTHIEVPTISKYLKIDDLKNNLETDPGQYDKIFNKTKTYPPGKVPGCPTCNESPISNDNAIHDQSVEAEDSSLGVSTSSSNHKSGHANKKQEDKKILISSDKPLECALTSKEKIEFEKEKAGFINLLTQENLDVDLFLTDLLAIKCDRGKYIWLLSLKKKLIVNLGLG